MQNPYRQYQKTQVTTASREKILLMLYEGAIRFTKQAIAAMHEKEIAKKGKFISKATAIISELMATLDFKAGGELAYDLENLYIYMIDKLIEGNINNDVKCLENVEEILKTLHTAWKDVVDNPREDGVPSKELQPQEYETYVKSNKAPSTSQDKGSNFSQSNVKAEDRPQLKIMT